MSEFKKLLSELEADASIQVLTGVLQPPATADQIAAAEEAIGAPLHPTIRAFYEAHNGVCIRWISKNNDDFDEELHVRDDEELPFAMDLAEDYDPQYPDGVIYMYPIQETLFASWDDYPSDSQFELDIYAEEVLKYEDCEDEEPFAYGEREFEDENAYRAQLRLADFYTRDEAIFLLFEPGNGDPILIYYPAFYFSEDSTREYMNQKRAMPFSKYLDLVAGTRGDAMARDGLFSQNGKAPS